MRTALFLSALLAAGCATFDAPPEASIEGLAQGKLTDPSAPIVIAFDKAPRLETLKLEIAPYVLDDEGNLGDEDQDPKTSLDPYFTYDGKTGAVTGGEATLAKDGAKLTVKLEKDLPVGSTLVLLVEPGLADSQGAVTRERRRLVFSYSSGLTCDAPVAVMRSGTYFFLSNISEPVHVPVALFAVLKIDPDTGAVESRFTKARRNPDLGRCPDLGCDSTQVCRLVPAPACVAPSEPAASVDEFSDYVPNPDPPTGFVFAVVGCAVDQDAETSAFTTAHVDVETQQPAVTLKKAQLSAAFAPDAKGVLRGTGSLSAESVMLGIIDSGKGIGDLTGRSLEDAEAPPGIPGP